MTTNVLNAVYYDYQSKTDRVKPTHAFPRQYIEVLYELHVKNGRGNDRTGISLIKRKVPHNSEHDCLLINFTLESIRKELLRILESKIQADKIYKDIRNLNVYEYENYIWPTCH